MKVCGPLPDKKKTKTILTNLTELVQKTESFRVLYERDDAHFWCGLLGPWVKGLRPKLLLPPIPDAWTKRTQSQQNKARS